MYKKSKGITLIALIITVIVLVILAGTAIGIAINGGDIFGKASEAREAWNVAVENENKTLKDLVSYLIPGKPTGIIKSSIYLNGNDSVLRVKATGGEAYKYKLSTLDTWSDAIPNETEFEFTGLTLDQIYTVQAICTNSFGDGTEIAEAQLKVAYEGNIGNYVHYPVNLGIGSTSGSNEFDDDWVVLYEDKDDGITYLIAADYVPKEIILNKGTSTRAGLKAWNSNVYGVHWFSPRDFYGDGSNIDLNNRVYEKFSNWYNGENALYGKQMAPLILLDSNSWDDFILKNNDIPYDNSIQAVGAPTLELWIESVKQRGYQKYIWQINNTDTVNGVGYLVAKEGTEFKNGEVAPRDTLLNNKVYYPYIGTKEDCYGYWLATPSIVGDYYHIFTIQYYNNERKNIWNIIRF